MNATFPSGETCLLLIASSLRLSLLQLFIMMGSSVITGEYGNVHTFAFSFQIHAGFGWELFKSFMFSCSDSDVQAHSH